MSRVGVGRMVTVVAEDQSASGLAVWMVVDLSSECGGGRKWNVWLE